MTNFVRIFSEVFFKSLLVKKIVVIFSGSLFILTTLFLFYTNPKYISADHETHVQVFQFFYARDSH